MTCAGLPCLINARVEGPGNTPSQYLHVFAPLLVCVLIVEPCLDSDMQQTNLDRGPIVVGAHGNTISGLDCQLLLQQCGRWKSAEGINNG
jgi:hypothetical protein